MRAHVCVCVCVCVYTEAEEAQKKGNVVAVRLRTKARYFTPFSHCSKTAGLADVCMGSDSRLACSVCIVCTAGAAGWQGAWLSWKNMGKDMGD